MKVLTSSFSGTGEVICGNFFLLALKNVWLENIGLRRISM